MEELLNYLNQFANLTDSDRKCITAHAQEISLARDDYFLDINEIPKFFCFVRQGVLRTGTYNSAGDEVINRFVVDQHFLSDVYAFSGRRASREFVQAALDTKLVTFNAEAMRHLCTLVRSWETLMAMIAIRVLNEKESGRVKLSGTTAASRYLAFERNYPGLTDRIGLCHVALYLGISTSTLSRIRKNPGRPARCERMGPVSSPASRVAFDNYRYI